ncbi:MAG: hypothetical protein COT17_01790 [Elusimicrobia bacterium CG08_land_8_20_14_0_20_51_18]|nr:MAG: hypothetical protein COT17_01790 [Elusimicrobia bacterium CG08_land_8_20_14_0_20_51_18]
MKDKIELVRSLLDSENSEGALKILRSLKKDYEYDLLTGEACRIGGFFHEAAAHYRKFIKKSRPDIFRLEAMNKLAACSRALGDKKNAFGWGKKALSYSVKKGFDTLDSRIELAMAQRLAGDFPGALTEIRRIAAFFMKNGDFAGLSYMLWSAGGIYRLQGEFAKAEEAFGRALKLAKRAGDRSLQVYALFGLAGALRIAGRVEDSYRTYLKASKLAGGDDTFANAYSFCGMANSLRQKGELDRAKGSYKNSLKLYTRIGDKVDLGFVHWGLGEIQKKKGQFGAALEKFLKAGELFRSGFEKRGEILNDISLAQVYYLRGKTELADRIYFKALARAKKEKLHTYLEIFT